jgi:hypothetical protein
MFNYHCFSSENMSRIQRVMESARQSVEYHGGQISEEDLRLRVSIDADFLRLNAQWAFGYVRNRLQPAGVKIETKTTRMYKV